MRKITIIGAGSVGSTIAYTLALSGLASDIVMIDINKKKSAGEALDIMQGTPFFHPCSIYSGDYLDSAGSDIVIITSGVARKPGQTRLDLAQTNVDILRSISGSVVKYAPHAIYIIVSNPVDILTYAFCKFSGLNESHIIGSGTVLDTARLRTRISEYYDINQQNVHAYVFGEHGDSAFVPWSLAGISSIPVSNYKNCVTHRTLFPDLVEDTVEEYVRNAGALVIEQKGATFYAIAMSVCYLCRCILNDTNTPITVSTMMNGEYGINDICLSVLNIIGGNGVRNKVLPPLTNEEMTDLHYSAKCLRDTLASIKI